ncbi:MAG TPA: Rpn family recombination-promoting nuclease/putative transposase [Thermoanaerobaculia bacterium]|nr:Rpn family recombination-promoting nuclease/putative transposase [Thermoanaerobaculia bacterium]
MADHDHTYKVLFSHAEMVADLIRGFVHEDWVEEVDFSTLERVDATFITEELVERESDIIWRVRWGGKRWLYVYLLIEFQSTVDPWMALRVVVYIGLLWQRLARDGELTPSGRLPPVLPLVLYNGVRLWNAALELALLIEEIPGLDRYRPQFRYCLLDEGRMADEELAPLRNLAAALFRLEKSRDAATIDGVLTSLLEWLRSPEQSSLRRAFAVWILKVLANRLPGVEIPQLADLQEVKSMLAENITEWTRQWKQEGFEEGRQDALEQLRSALLREMEERFGEVPESVRGRVAALNSFEEIAKLIVRTATASSLTAMGF